MKDRLKDKTVAPDFRAFFEAVPGHCFIARTDGPIFTIVAVSDAYLEAVGTKRADIVDAPQNIEYLTAFVQSGYRLINTESNEIDKDGHTKYFLNNLTCFFEGEKVVHATKTSAKKAQVTVHDFGIWLLAFSYCISHPKISPFVLMYKFNKPVTSERTI